MRYEILKEMKTKNETMVKGSIIDTASDKWEEVRCPISNKSGCNEYERSCLRCMKGNGFIAKAE